MGSFSNLLTHFYVSKFQNMIVLTRYLTIFELEVICGRLMYSIFNINDLKSSWLDVLNGTHSS